MKLSTPSILKNYTGYIKELVLYSGFPFKAKREPEIKFLIFTVGRTGSNLLVDLLSTHPMIYCHSELLEKRLFFPYAYLRANERLSPKIIYGFKIILYNFNVQKFINPAYLLDLLIDQGYQLINLKRNNIIRQVLSHMYAMHRQQFHVRKGQENSHTDPMTIDLEFLQRDIKLFEDFRALEHEMLLDRTYLQLTYEEDLMMEYNHQNAINKITNFLQIPPAKVTTRLDKTTPVDLAKIISNYHEVKSLIDCSQYRGLLTSD